MVLDWKSSQEYPVNAGVSQGSILGPALFLLYMNDLPENVICNIATYADDATLDSKCDQASDLWQQLELASELKSNLWQTMDWGKRWLVDFNDGKTQLVLFDRSNNNCSIDMKMVGQFLRKSHLLRCLCWHSLLNWIGALTLSLLLKLPSRKLELVFILWSFVLLRLLCIYKSSHTAKHRILMPSLGWFP